MNAHASAGKKSLASVLHHCERLDMRAETAEEAMWLAMLNRLLMDGGKLTIEPAGRDGLVVKFAGLADESAPPLPTPGA